MRMPRALLVLVALVLTVALPGTAGAADVPIQGGPGGGPFRLQCPPNMFMLGAAVRSGGWVDAIRANCAGFNPSTHQFVRPPQFTAFTGGPGGSLQQSGCSEDRFVSGIKIGFTRDGNRPKYLDYIEMRCSVLSGYGGDTRVCLQTGNGCWDRHPNPGPYNGYGLSFTLSCPAGQAAIGLFGRSGLYVDGVGLICGPKPQATGPVAGTTTQPPPTPTSLPPPGLSGDLLALFNEHNRHRADHCTPALTWSTKLATDAQTSANRCPTDHNRPELAAQNENENLYWGSGGPSFTGPQAAINSWYGEIKDYNFNAPVLVFNASEGKGLPNGHFTQVVWKATTQIGCASKVCGATTHWSCRYAPPGNFNAHTPDVSPAVAVASLNANVLRKCR